MGTTDVLIERDDVSGGSGAPFLVEWVSGSNVTEPIIEAVMIDTGNWQGISFVSGARGVREIGPKKTSPIQLRKSGQISKLTPVRASA